MLNTKTLFNDGWEFARSGLDQDSSANLRFAPVDLPHDWLIGDTSDLFADSIGWYRRLYFHKPSAKQILLYFEGVYLDSTLYVNGQEMGSWKYGYSSFEHEITNVLQAGENELILKVVYRHPNSRWYSGAGIYRNVWLKKRGETHLPTHGIYVSAQREKDGWLLLIDTELNLSQTVLLEHRLELENRLVKRSTKEIEFAGCSFLVDRQNLIIPQPSLWSPEQPNLYRLTTVLRSQIPGEAVILEEVSQNIGLRQVEFNPQKGFFLNGKPLKFQGVCEHHDLGALGAVFNKAAQKRRLGILKKMGVNALRTAHNMPAEELMDLADEMGFLVVSEAFDVWELPKTEYDYSRFFPEWAERDLESWVRRDRNHPSLILWSLGNEIFDTQLAQAGLEITKQLHDWVLKHDWRQNARITLCSNYLGFEATQKCADLLKIVGYNYGERYYHEHHLSYPDWCIFGSETLAMAQSRGIYHFPLGKLILGDDDQQCSSLGNSPTSWGALSVAAVLSAEQRAPFSLGQFIWSGFDYLGEPVPHNTKNSYLGQIDTATFPKDSYYVFQAAWTDYKISPMIHIFPYWDFNPGQLIDVGVVSNAPRLELRLNGKIVGEQVLPDPRGVGNAASWQIAYQPGELSALAYDQAGNLIASAKRSSFGDARRLCLQADKNTLWADGRDLIFVEISAVDAQGNPVENATNRIEVEVTGNGRLVGLDNGDSSDYDQYQGLSRRLFSGKLMALLASTLQAGPLEIKVSSPGLPAQSLRFDSLPVSPKSAAGLGACRKNSELPIVLGKRGEIPLRKLEILSPQGRKFGPEKRKLKVAVLLHPSNASYGEVQWSAVNDFGAPSPLATIEARETEAVITARGDGQFRVRCFSKNGGSATRLISELEFEAQGLGPALKDPYQFISASLYDYSRGELAPGLDKGITTTSAGLSVLGYFALDFGAYGSDQLTLSIFARSGDPYLIQIWEGLPGKEGSRLLKRAVYQKTPIWREYQAVTYTLPQRLKGVSSLVLVAEDQLEFQGFVFKG